jgi:GNAT superfamily N-acetyltransferase
VGEGFCAVTFNPGIYLLMIEKQQHRFYFILPEGFRILCRPVVPGDHERIKNLVASMSEQSRYFRFFSPIMELSDEQARYFTEIDQKNHVAWIAVEPSAPHFHGLGVARFVRLPDQPHIAETAFAVIDAYHHRGLGSVLLAILYLLAQENGIHILRASVLPENRLVTAWLHHLGAVMKFEEGVYRFDLPVRLDQASLPPTASGEKFKSLLENLRQLLAAKPDE